MEATASQRARGEGEGAYAHEHRPLGAYSAITSTFLATFAASVAAARGRRRFEPTALDLVTAGAATHKLSRLITLGKSTSFLRSPFVRYEGGAGQGEVSEKPRGRGLRLAIGELLVCPYCIGQWVAAGFGVGLATAPRATRLVAFVYATEALADFLQVTYAERGGSG
jgi:hypothetical protein